jgi:hypothetical protein
LLTVRAHKAANPAKYPVRDDVRAFLPYYEGIEERHKPTRVHLQVYDGASSLGTCSPPGSANDQASATTSRYSA